MCAVSASESSVSSPILAIVAASGGSFLLENRLPEEVFTPEDLSEEQRQMAETAARFAREQIGPAAGRMEAKEPGLMRRLLEQAGELGFAAVDVPEAYGGLGSDKIAAALVAENLTASASFSAALGAHTGIGTTPIVWYGTEEQKQRYLPRLASLEWVAAYALSEASSGSDAMNIRTRAVLSGDGESYLLNGEKMWITNAGLADLFIVFAKIVAAGAEVSAGQFSAFLVERGAAGFSIGKEEHKLGIRGSSTCALVFADCRIPANSLLGEAGKGHHIAFNILNLGRFKLGAACIGGARQALEVGIAYAKERKAFGKSIAEFGLIQRKIASSAVRLFVTESMTYRTVGLLEAALVDLPDAGSDGGISGSAPREDQKAIGKSMAEYAVECSIVKVYASEMLGLVTDELVQIMGGYGYVEDYPAERLYRDARINRIFEGTNEINRLIITGWLMKRAQSGKLPLLAAIRQLMDEVTQAPQLAGEATGAMLERETQLLASLRKIFLLAAGVASQRFMTALEEQQEVMADLADCVMAIYGLESVLLRAQKLSAKRSSADSVVVEMTTVFADEALATVEQAARRVIAASAEGDALGMQLAIFRRLARVTPVDAVTLQRSIARHFLEAGRYRL